jgi:glycosyltransferase involved in cell wall biosynthesis
VAFQVLHHCLGGTLWLADEGIMLLSITIPMYNEAESLPTLMARLRPVARAIDWDYELILVNDDSTDETGKILDDMAAWDHRVKVLSFSRNLAHQAAVTAGLDFANGDGAAVMDADLQDPPELLPEVLGLMRQGYDVVSAQRGARPGDGIWKRSMGAGFYWFMRRFIDRRLAPEVGDFRLFSRTAVLALRGFREQHRFMRGLVAWLGLKEAIVPFHRESRAHGTTKYPLFKMLQLAWTAVSSFSALPLRLSTTLGMFVTLFGVGYFLYSIFAAVIAKTTIPGWTSLVCLQIVFSGTILSAVGLVGSYVARIYEESKQRPLDVVAGLNNFEIWETLPQRGVVLESSNAATAIGDRSIPVAIRV